ncbi:uncharacterized protein LOC135378922 isoform X2 [Ornithodoros turicata]|uniref:uncharacterized protein LOC135378922 isoform X2 n=1 Tax=Ornithodoros turicata TaxID=34597 RepID=UPI0031390948
MSDELSRTQPCSAVVHSEQRTHSQGDSEQLIRRQAAQVAYFRRRQPKGIWCGSLPRAQTENATQSDKTECLQSCVLDNRSPAAARDCHQRSICPKAALCVRIFRHRKGLRHCMAVWYSAGPARSGNKRPHVSQHCQFPSRTVISGPGWIDTLSPIHTRERCTAKIRPKCDAFHCNSIASAIPLSVRYSLYVDDVQKSCSSSSIARCERQLQLTVNKLVKWSHENGLKFSPEKTVCVSFSRVRGLFPEPTLKMGSHNIIVKPEHKFLGLIFDRKLTFLPHLKHLKVKVIKGAFSAVLGSRS